MPIASDDELHKLLASKRISAITIDTSIFDAKQLNLNSSPLKNINNLHSSPFYFILSETVAKETQGHIEKAAMDALRASKKEIGTLLRSFDIKTPTRDDIFNNITGGKTAKQIAEERFRDYINNTNCDILVDTDIVNSKELMEMYIKNEPPFGQGKKKSEFPDAFALISLEKTAAARDTCILVVSMDGDWRNFCEKSERLYLVRELEPALALMQNAPAALRKNLAQWLVDDKPAEVQHLLENRVEHIDFSVEAYSSANYMEAIPWTGHLKKTEWPTEDKFDIIDVSRGNDITIVTISVPLVLMIEITIELEFSAWDSIDHESVGLGGRTIETEAEISCRATIIIHVYNAGNDEDEYLEINGCEIDVYRYNIDLGEVEVFEAEYD